MKARIIEEGETAFTGSIPGENLVAQHDAKAGGSASGLATLAENSAKAKAGGGLEQWEMI
ncbi:MAG: hypothetical protein WKG00_09920 [Polyangiaceae bacterium]